MESLISPLIIPLGAFVLVAFLMILDAMKRMREAELSAYRELRIREMEHLRHLKELDVEHARATSSPLHPIANRYGQAGPRVPYILPATTHLRRPGSL